MRTYGLVHVLGNIIGPATEQVHKLLMCSWAVLFPFPWFSGGCVFSSCWLRFMWLCVIADYLPAS